MDTIKGFRDIEGEEALKRERIKEILAETFKEYGFEPVETPMIESEEFVRGENKEDEAVSDIYKLEDKGKRKLALRYEFTFQLKRLMRNKKLPYKRYQIGEVFRDEPTSEGKERYRQFTQCDVDVVGSSVREEAEILSLVKEILDKLGIKFVIYFNNRKLLNEILDQFDIQEKMRSYIIREIDKLDKVPEKEILKELKGMKAQEILKALKSNKGFERFESYKEVEELKKFAKYYGLKDNELVFSPTLARGLSYYDGTVFEVKSISKGSLKETITAGGSYTFNGIKSTGISFGLDRLCSLVNVKTLLKNKSKILVISIGEEKDAIKLVQKLRARSNSCVEIMYDKVSKALEYANSKKIDEVIFVGKEEIKKKKFKVKDMISGKEKLVGESELMKV